MADKLHSFIDMFGTWLFWLLNTNIIVYGDLQVSWLGFLGALIMVGITIKALISKWG